MRKNSTPTAAEIKMVLRWTTEVAEDSPVTKALINSIDHIDNTHPLQINAKKAPFQVGTGRVTVFVYKHEPNSYERKENIKAFRNDMVSGYLQIH